MSELKVGDKIPQFEFKTMKDEKIEAISTNAIFPGKLVVLFSIPGAFTPTCSSIHCPGFVLNALQLKNKGVDVVACTAVNDPFVLDAWSKSQNADGKILFLADGSAEFVKKIGMENDLTNAGLGMRGKRFAAIIKDGVVQWVGVDLKGASLSTAEEVIKHL